MRLSDDRLELAYDAAVNALDQQDDTLSNLRNRATAVVSSTALVASFSAAAGLLNTDPAKGDIVPDWARLTMLAVLAAVAALCMVVLWPVRRWSYGPDAKKILDRIVLGDDVDGVRRYVVGELLLGRKRNSDALKVRHSCYRVAVLGLVVEAATVVAAFVT